MWQPYLTLLYLPPPSLTPPSLTPPYFTPLHLLHIPLLSYLPLNAHTDYHTDCHTDCHTDYHTDCHTNCLLSIQYEVSNIEMERDRAVSERKRVQSALEDARDEMRLVGRTVVHVLCCDVMRCMWCYVMRCRILHDSVTLCTARPVCTASTVSYECVQTTHLYSTPLPSALNLMPLTLTSNPVPHCTLYYPKQCSQEGEKRSTQKHGKLHK